MPIEARQQGITHNSFITEVKFRQHSSIMK